MMNIKQWYHPHRQIPITNEEAVKETRRMVENRIPLGYAAEHGLLDAIKYLLRIDPGSRALPYNSVNGVPYTSLMVACHYRRSNSVQCLVQEDPPTHWHARASNHPTNCAFRVALATSNLHLLKDAQSTFPDDVNSIDSSRMSHWIYACHQFQVSDAVFEWLLQSQHADPNAVGSNGSPLIHVAAAMYLPVRIRLLLRYGARPDAVDAQGRCAALFLADYLRGERPDTVASPTSDVIDALYDALWGRGTQRVGADSDHPLIRAQYRRFLGRFARKRALS